jgi:hypothetical protein
MVKLCGCCGAQFHGRSDAMFCSKKCKERKRRERLAAGSTTPKPKPSPAPVVALPAQTPDPAPPKSGLVRAIEKQLAKAERLDTPAGQMALVLAERLSSGRDTGSALATLSRELTARMGEALAGATIEPDELDELAERRLRKVSGG